MAPPLLVAHAVVLAIFVALGFGSVGKFHPADQFSA
jgi:hypothetical protein